MAIREDRALFEAARQEVNLGQRVAYVTPTDFPGNDSDIAEHHELIGQEFARGRKKHQQ